MTSSSGGAPDDPTAVLGARLSAFRRRALLTQEELADRSGVSVRAIRQLEAGRVRQPRSESLRRLADALGLTEPERTALASADPADPVPPPAAPVAPGCRLPMDVAGFTGRTGDLARLDGLLSGAAGAPAPMVLATVGGTAGVGKTALALHWAHRVRERFPGGQLYLDLQGFGPGPPLAPTQALARVLHALGVEPDRVPTETDAAAGLYRSLLTDRRVLVVLDNAGNAEQVRPLVPASPGCMVLVTSRDRLAGLVATHGAHRLGLDVLQTDEAVVLLGHILGDDRVHRDPAAAAELVRICGHLPLAVRIAAANLAFQPWQPLERYVARLQAGDRLAELAVAGDADTAVRVAFDGSYATLDADGRRLFRILGPVPGPEFTAPVAAALAGVPLAQAERLLERLSGAHLVEQRAPGRFGFHDLLRLYADQRSRHEDDERERRDATGRMLACYLQAADAAARLLYPEKTRLPLPPAGIQAPPVELGDRARALAWLDAERPNLVAAVEQAAEHGPHPPAWLLADTLRGYFILRRFMLEWSAVARAGLAAAEADGQLRAQAAAHLSLGDISMFEHRHDQAVTAYTRAVALARQAGWLHGEAAVLGNLGMVHLQLGRLEEAGGHHARALVIDRRLGNLAGQAVDLGNLAIVARLLGRLEEAADHDTQALRLYRATGSSYGEALTLLSLGTAYHALGRLDDAVDHLTHALALQREVGDRGNEGDTLQRLAAVHGDAGRHDLALELGEAAMAVARDTGEQGIEADAAAVLAAVHLRRGDHRLAAGHAEEAVRLAAGSGDGYCEAGALLRLAQVRRQLGERGQGLAVAGQALSLARDGGFRLIEGEALATLADIELDQGRPGQAVEHARQALAIQDDCDHDLGRARTLVTLGRAQRHLDGTGPPTAARA